MKEWLIPTLGAVICWAGWAFLPKIAMQYLEPKSVLIYEVLGGLTIGLFILASLNYQLEIELKGISLAFASGALNILGVLFYLQAIAKGKVALVSTISALYPLLVIILALFLLQESLSLKQFFGLSLGLFSIILLVT
ncbi:EamA family transporter [Calothrix rhizosoleniae]|uniref:EamA family transporter n=1 Tax=Calothrix rhizosoleniae TaxID=888997 RepID=UPI000B49C63C|nr:DMT family transporter [Calothrix rhizosoleniae]